MNLPQKIRAALSEFTKMVAEESEEALAVRIAEQKARRTRTWECLVSAGRALLENDQASEPEAIGEMLGAATLLIRVVEDWEPSPEDGESFRRAMERVRVMRGRTGNG